MDIPVTESAATLEFDAIAHYRRDGYLVLRRVLTRTTSNNA